MASLTPSCRQTSAGGVPALDLAEGVRDLLFGELRLLHGPRSLVKDRPKPLSSSSFELPSFSGETSEEHKAKRAEIREARKAGREYCPRLVQRQRPTLFEDILADYMEYSARNKRSHNNDRVKAESFTGRFRDRLATDITARDVEDLRRPRE